MMLNSVWVWLALPISAGLGWGAAAIGEAYARHIAQGADIDDATLLKALRDGLTLPSLRSVPCGLVLVCMGLSIGVSLAFVQQPDWPTAARCAACGVLLALAVIDARCGLLPNALTLPLLWAGLLLAWAGAGVGLHDAVVAASATYVLLRLLDALFAACRGLSGIGGGDIKLCAALGAWLGWAPLPAVLLAACLAGILFAAVAAGSKGWRATLAFGPFLALAGASGLIGNPVVKFFF